MNFKWGRISSREEYQVGKIIEWERILNGREYQVGKIIEWGRILNWEGIGKQGRV